MFITTVTQKYGKKTYEYQHLLESIRTEQGPRQRFLLNLGKLDLSDAEWPLLAKRIEEYIRGQETVFSGSPEIERLASHYAQKFLRKHEVEYAESGKGTFESIDIDSMENDRVRTVGAEYVSLAYFQKLELDRCLKECGFTQREAEAAAMLIIGRMASPGSERHTHDWAQNTSALDELLGTDFSSLSLNTLYDVCDKIHENKDAIEKHLRERERDLFGLDEKIILYDLTNTFLEGLAGRNPKAKFGRSKEKRAGCRLLTLGLVIDGKGFPKTSRVFSGNQSEPKTLLEMIRVLRKEDPVGADKPTVVMDAGIATDENLQALKSNYHYVCVSRKHMAPPLSGDFILIREGKDHQVEAKRISGEGEVFVYCKSQGEQKKEKAMQGRFEQHFEEQLKRIAESIHKKGSTKRYQKVCERIGRLKEKYSRIARFYHIVVEEKEGLASRITWDYLRDESNQRFSGSYTLRTDRTDLSEKQIWELYAMLHEVEETFRSIKSELEIQPNFHQKEDRCDTHILIAILAYHILHSIRTRLKQVGINYRWETILGKLSTHFRVTNRMKSREGKTIRVRKCSNPEVFQKTIYDALQLDYAPCKTTKVII
jgi:transposase